jgi:hypothetical protein
MSLLSVLTFIVTLFLGTSAFLIYSKLYDHLPKIRRGRLELLPSIRIRISGRVFHIHHWFSFLLILTISIFISEGLLASVGIRGFCTGCIIQGIFFPGKHYGRRLVFKE